jgi:phosphotransferase system  glucose/maltose/N-acetylglucosamine-specific IIC component
MVVVTVMPAAGLMISLGKLITIISRDVIICASGRKNYGRYRLGYQHVLFVAAIGGSWAKERAGDLQHWSHSC